MNEQFRQILTATKTLHILQTIGCQTLPHHLHAPHARRPQTGLGGITKLTRNPISQIARFGGEIKIFPKSLKTPMCVNV
jgi:starvation-inducible outer membrane lipoprotein